MRLQAPSPVATLATHLRPFVDGSYVSGASGRALIDPSTGKEICTVEEADAALVDRAVKAARKAFDHGTWPHLPAVQRAMKLLQVADLLERRAEEFARLESLNAGKPMREARFDIQDCVNCLRYHAGLVTVAAGQTISVPSPSISHTVRQPIGVCAQIIPWNYPLQMAVWKIAPALIAGNTCVLKPSELTPITALLLMELMQQADLPPGVVNVVTGDGASAGMALCSHPMIDKVAFTGSDRTGRIVAAAAIAQMKKVTLLGGKSPLVVFADSDLDTAVDYALYANYCHAGQVCSAGTRFIIESSVFEDFTNRFVERIGKIRVGPAMVEDTEMGPLISEQQRLRVLKYIESGIADGAKLLCGGEALNGGRLQNGFYVSPAAFTEVNSNMRVVKEEIFGPVAVLQPFKDEADAAGLANDTKYGLAGAVFTNDPSRAHRVAKAIRAGVVWINGYHNCYNECPFGGYKQSGWGRECGTFGVENYTEVKQINLNLSPGPVGWFRH